MTKISIAIPYHGNRWQYVKKNLETLTNDARIYEFVIVDDNSKAEDYERLTAGVEEMQPKVSFPVRVYRNDENLFVFKNKCQAVNSTRGEWVCLLDSDNCIDGAYLDAWDKARDEDSRRVYLPEFAKPEFDYRRYSDKTFTSSNSHLFMKKPMYECMLNTMNYIVNRYFFLNAMKTGRVEGFEPLTSDSMWINYLLLQAGAKLYVTPEMQYDHAVHDGSTWRLHHERAKREAKHITDLYTRLRG